MWIIEPLQRKANLRWRLVAWSDEGGGTHADESHDHTTAEEASNCEQCDEYCSRITGFPSKKARAAQQEAEEAALKAKYGKS